MKKWIIAVLAVAFFMCSVAVAWSEDKKSIILKIGDPFMTVNGVKQEIDPGRGTKPVKIEGRTLVPIRTIVENMGGIVNWIQASNQVQILVYTKTVTLTINSLEAVVEDKVYASSKTETLDVAPMVINDRTMTPVRFVSETLGALVGWNEQKQMVTIDFAESTKNMPPSHIKPVPSNTSSSSGQSSTGAPATTTPSTGTQVTTDSHEGVPQITTPPPSVPPGNENCLKCHPEHLDGDIK